jgi:hypothetical protein
MGPIRNSQYSSAAPIVMIAVSITAGTLRLGARLLMNNTSASPTRGYCSR